MVEHEVGRYEAGKKVHRLIRQLLPGIPLSGIYKMIRTGRVKRNGKKAKADDLIELGDVIRLYIAESDYAEVSKPTKKFGGVSAAVDVLYEDHEMVAVNKPAGLLTHGAIGEYKDTLVNRVLAYLHQKGELDSRIFSPSPVNRLDRNTSGIVLFAKSGLAARNLTSESSHQILKKYYVALVKGVISKEGQILENLQRIDDTRTEVAVKGGKSSVTQYEPLVSHGSSTVVKIRLLSGRTHQIRAHFRHLGHPLIDDVKYGGGKAVPEGEQPIHQWLHAISIELPNGKKIDAPLPAAFLDKLRALGYTAKEMQKIR